MAQKNLIEKLADAGEDALTKLAGASAAHKVLEATSGVTKRLDEMQKRLRGLADVEKKVARLERRLAKLEAAGRAKTPGAKKRASASSRSSTPRKKTD
jgi:hypothetical protein